MLPCILPHGIHDKTKVGKSLSNLSKFAGFSNNNHMTRGLHKIFAAAALSSFFICEGISAEAQEKKQYGIIDFSVSYLRQSPDYESPLETQELMGTVVEITGRKSYWLEVSTPQPYTAWCTDKGVTPASEEEVEEWISSRRYIVTASYSGVYAEPSGRSAVVCDLVAGDIVKAVLGKPQRRFRTYGLPIRQNGWAKVETPSGRQGWTRTADIRDFYKWAEECSKSLDQVSAETSETECTLGNNSNASKKAAKDGAKKTKKAKKTATETVCENIVATAKKYVGTPYLWGGMSPKGFDCSGLVRISYFLNGVLLPRNANQMALCGLPVPVFRTASGESGAATNATASERTFCADSLRAGDLLFFGSRGTDGGEDRITHVGLYIGGGKMIHSSHLVRINSLTPGEDDYYENAHRLLSAVRILGYEGLSRGEYKADRVLNSVRYFR